MYHCTWHLDIKVKLCSEKSTECLKTFLYIKPCFYWTSVSQRQMADLILVRDRYNPPAARVIKGSQGYEPQATNLFYLIFRFRVTVFCFNFSFKAGSTCKTNKNTANMFAFKNFLGFKEISTSNKLNIGTCKPSSPLNELMCSLFRYQDDEHSTSIGLKRDRSTTKLFKSKQK